MIFLFPLTTALYIFVLLIAAFGTFLFLIDKIPFVICILIVVIAFIFQLGIVKLSYFLYIKSLNRCDKDYSGFVKEQDKLIMRSGKSNRKLAIMKMLSANEIIGMLSHDDFQNVRVRLNQLGQIINEDEESMRLQYLTILMSADMKEKNYSSAEYYLNKTKEFYYNSHLSKMQFKGKERIECSLEYDGIELDFYRLSPDDISEKRKAAAEKLISSSDKMMEFFSEIKVYQNMYKIMILFDKAAAYAALGNEQQAIDIADEIINTDTTYPIVEKAKKYKETKDASYLIK